MPKYIVVGLGNPGTRFTKTRHNLGQRAVQLWQTTQPELTNSVVIYEPTVFMNETGPAVAALLRANYAIPEQLLVIHDDVELEFGVIKHKPGGSANGHNGVRSIQETLGTQTIERIRLGVGRPTGNQEMSQFVLQPFTAAEEAAMPEFLDRAATEITKIITA